MSDALISIISICVTLILGVIGFIMNSLIQRKNNSIEIITKKRIARRDTILNISTTIIKLSDEDYIQNIAVSDWKAYIDELIENCAKLRAILEFEYARDKEFVNAAYNLKDRIIKSKGKSEINNQKYRKEFIKLMDVYTLTEWQRIKLETVGKKSNKHRGYDWNCLFDNNIIKYDEQVKE